MRYSDLFTLGVLAIVLGIILFITCLVLFFKLDIKGIIRIFIRKLKVILIISIPALLFFQSNVYGSEMAGNKESEDVVAKNNYPKISIAKTGKYILDDENEVFYKGDLTLDINISDQNGLKNVSCAINGKEVLSKKDLLSEKGGLIRSCNFKLDKGFFKNGKNSLRIKAINYAGYEEIEELTIFSDSCTPIIEKSYIDGASKYIDDSQGTYYSDKDVSIDIVLMDYDDSDKKRANCVSSVNLSMYDVKGEIIDQREIFCDKNGNMEFTLKCGFRGYCIIRAKDEFDNELIFKTRQFIIEGREEFLRDTKIFFEKEDKDFSSNEVFLPVVVNSTYSGIKKASYEIISPNDIVKNKSESLELRGERVEGILYSGKGEISVNNNSNDIKVIVKIESYCGNTIEESITLNIDRTYPVINASFLDGKTDYYINHNRTLEIEIVERNFFKENLNINIIKDGIDIGESLEFETVVNEYNPDFNRHIATIELNEEGEYHIFGGIRDTAGNTAALKEQSFYIDKTVPLAELICKEDMEDKVYTNKPMHFLLKIVEDNLDLESIKIEGLDNSNKEYSYINGCYERELSFENDGECQLVVTGNDKAGNFLNKVISNKYILDLTYPNILIEDLINNKSYNDVFSFKGEISDEYLDIENCSVNLNKESKGEIPQLLFDKKDGKFLFYIKDLPRLKEYDGLYNLKIFGRDFAGNEKEESIRFSINRFGSSFILSKDLTDISNSFTRVMGNVDIEEVNYDDINPESTRVFLFRNGDTRLLNLEKDYEIYQNNNGFKNSVTYSIAKDNFLEDGIYAISIYSIDDAGNTNLMNKGENLVSFVVDRTSPRIYPLNVSSNEDYNRPISVEVRAFDNMKLKNVSAFNNDEPISIENTKDKYRLYLPENNKRYNIKLVAEDAAGNTVEKKIKNLSIGYEKKLNMYAVLLIFVILVFFIMGIILIIKNVKRRTHGKRKDYRAY